jgi:hypothetical protein
MDRNYRLGETADVGSQTEAETGHGGLVLGDKAAKSGNRAMGAEKRDITPAAFEHVSDHSQTER